MDTSKEYIKTAKHRAKLSMAMKGNKNQEKKRSKLTKKKIAKALKGNRHTFGYKHSKGMKLKCQLAKTRIKNPAWRGGVSFEPYSPEWKRDIKNSIKIRDSHTCQICQTSYNSLSKRLHVHHIDYNKKNCLPENLITLCHCCHSKTNHKRKFWQKYLKEVINGQVQRVLIDVS